MCLLTEKTIETEKLPETEITPEPLDTKVAEEAELKPEGTKTLTMTLTSVLSFYLRT